jgi:hypothetical protein
MEFKIVNKDPLQVLTSTKFVADNLQYISISESKLYEVAEIVNNKIESGLDFSQNDFGFENNLEKHAQLIFIKNVASFCFWTEPGKSKWQVRYPENTELNGGLYSLIKCFIRALDNNIPILDAEFLSNLTLEQLRKILEGNTGVEIPLIEKRLENLKEAGRVLKEKYQGNFLSLLKENDFDAIKIVKAICKDFSSFRDISIWQNHKIYFLKRAQITVYDISRLEEKYDIHIKNSDMLTAFADYKLPQLLRKFGVIEYNSALAKKIDTSILIEQGSREEIEIRAVTIWCVELVRQILKKYSSADIDDALWLISQNEERTQPNHKTYTIFY